MARAAPAPALHRPPPLHAVRAFVAAAQHLSFTRAAAELHVTHSAISRQVKALEEHLGTALFERRVRQVVLTPAGHAFHAEAAPALERIAAAARQIAGGPDDAADARTVRINVRPSFAVRWLIPRLPDFVAAHPGIAPEVLTTTAAPAKAADAFDIAIRRGTHGWPGDWPLQPFLEDAALVVGAPALLAARPVPQARAVAGHVLLDARSRSGDWDDWRRLHGGARPQRPAGRLALDHLHLVLQAAVDGLGLAMAPLSLTSHDLAAGRLVAPLPAQRLPLARHYYAVAPGAPVEAALFARWLETAARQDMDILPQ